MKTALIGHSGFVGQNLKRQFKFSHLYNTKNIKEIAGLHFDLLVVSAAKAEKWKANQNPSGDESHINELISHLSGVSAQTAILISTVDVYPNPVDVDENTKIDSANTHAYGKNRRNLEIFFQQRFDETRIVRLPGLFGTGIKKNVIFDLIHNNELDKIDSRGVFQFYNLDHIWRDIENCRNHNLSVVNFATQPLSVRELYKAFFNEDFVSEILPHPARYDMKTSFAKFWNKNIPYLYEKEQILLECKKFFDSERSKK